MNKNVKKKLTLKAETVRRLADDDLPLIRGAVTESVPHTNPPRPLADGGAARLGNCDTLVAPCGPTHQCTAVCGTQTCNVNCTIA